MEPSRTLPEPSAILRRVLLERIGRNPSYSLRAFARNLGVSHAYMSMLLSGKRRIPVHQAIRFSQLAGLPEDQRNALVAASRQAALERLPTTESKAIPRRPTPYFRLQLDDFKMLASWYHIAILEMLELGDFRPEPRWIACRLGLKTSEVRAAVRRLERLGLLSTEGGRWRKTHANLEILPFRSEEAVRRYHFQLIEKAMEAMKLAGEADFLRREIGAATMVVNPARLEEARRRIRRFRRSLMNYVTKGNCTELYQLNVQFFPLTRGRK